MHPSLTRPAAFVFAALLLAACGRKEDGETKRSPEAATPVAAAETPAPVAGPQLIVRIDRDKANAQGVTSGQVEMALVRAFGAQAVSVADNQTPSQIVFKITLSGNNLESRETVVRNSSGNLVQLTSLGTVEEVGRTVTENPDLAYLKRMDPAPVRTEAPTTPPPAASDERATYEAWFHKYNLDLNDPQMLAGDADGDGISNRDEFLAGTNPREAASKPGSAAPAVHNPLRFTDYNEAKLPLVLESVNGAQAVIKRVDGGENQTVRSGDVVRGFPLRVTKVTPQQSRDKDGNPVDRSQVLLEDTSTKERVTLVKGLPAKTSATYAVIASDDGKTIVKVHVGEVFAWPGEPPVSYRVVDLSHDQITLQEQTSKKLWTIPRQ
jgi:hypothetical protein